MKKTEALEKLAACIAKGTLPEAVFHGCAVQKGHWAYDTGLTSSQRTLLYQAYNGDLQAAFALQHMILPNRYWQLEEFDDAYTAGIVSPANGELSSHTSEHSPSRAWIEAIVGELIWRTKAE